MVMKSSRTVRVNSAFDVLMRIHAKGRDGVRADYASIRWRVIDRADGSQYHAGGTLTVSEVVFDTLQTDGRWNEDFIGYNFRQTIFHTVFTDVGNYIIEYTQTVDGNDSIVPYYVTTVGIDTEI